MTAVLSSLLDFPRVVLYRGPRLARLWHGRRFDGGDYISLWDNSRDTVCDRRRHTGYLLDSPWGGLPRVQTTSGAGKDWSVEGGPLVLVP